MPSPAGTALLVAAVLLAAAGVPVAGVILAALVAFFETWLAFQA